MPLFNRHHGAYPGYAPMRRGMGLRGLLMFLGIVFGIYFLNAGFLWIKIPPLSEPSLKLFNIITGALLVVLGLMTVSRPRHY